MKDEGIGRYYVADMNTTIQVVRNSRFCLVRLCFVKINKRLLKHRFFIFICLKVNRRHTIINYKYVYYKQSSNENVFDGFSNVFLSCITSGVNFLLIVPRINKSKTKKNRKSRRPWNRSVSSNPGAVMRGAPSCNHILEFVLGEIKIKTS